MKLLMSEQARSRWAPRVAEVLEGRPFEILSIEQAVHEQRRDFDVAFISRDVTGNSSKYRVEPALQACYDLLLANPALKWVHIHSAGADRPVFLHLRDKGVTLTTSSGANARVVATTAVAGVLSLARRFPMLWAQQQQRVWNPILGPGRMPCDLPGQRATIVGWGPIGQEVARLLQALGLTITAVRTQPTQACGGVEMVSYEDLPMVLPHTDWLLLACPLTSRTRAMVNGEFLAALPAQAHLINVARGEVVDEAALIEALLRGRLAGAFLDVFCQEPLPDESPFWNLPNVIVTPHGAGHSDGNETRVAELFLDNLHRWTTAQPLLNRVP